MYKNIHSCILGLAMLLFMTGACFAGPVGTVISLKGEAFAERSGSKVPLTLKAGVERGDTIVTAATGKVQIFFEDDTTVTIGPNARLQMQDFVASGKEPVFKAHILEGMARVITGKIVEKNPLGFTVTTPEATVGIRGTVLTINSRQGNTAVFVESTLKTVYLNDVLVPRGFKAASANLTPSVITPADLKAIEAEVGGATPTKSSSTSDSDSGSGDSSSGGGSGGGSDSGGSAAGGSDSSGSAGAVASSTGGGLSSSASASTGGGAGPSSALATSTTATQNNSAATFAALSEKLQPKNNQSPTPPPGPTPPTPPPPPPPTQGNVSGTLTAGHGGFIAGGTQGTFSFDFNLGTGRASNGRMTMSDNTNSFSLTGGTGGSFGGSRIGLGSGFTGTATINGNTYNLANSGAALNGNPGSWNALTNGNNFSGNYVTSFGNVPSGTPSGSTGTFDVTQNNVTP